MDKGSFLNATKLVITPFAASTSGTPASVYLLYIISHLEHERDSGQLGGWFRHHKVARRSPPMPPRILPILGRLRQDLAAALAPQTIEAACSHVGHEWRKRLLDPATTIYLFLLQVLHGNTACPHV